MKGTLKHPLQCRCGNLKGFVDNPQTANRVVCYCSDCQAFARWLGQESDILDERGGSHVIQTLPRNVTFTQGAQTLQCMRLTSKGLVRWYAGCCRTPIGNTLHSPKFSFIGLLHTCLESSMHSLDASFGPVRASVNTKSAQGEPKPKTRGVSTVVLWFVTTTAKARMNGDYKQTPFFDVDTGAPIVTPHVLSHEEREKAKFSTQTN
jgi:Family of unknown function (DUF6151)